MKNCLSVLICLVLLSGCSRSHLDIFPPLSNASLMHQAIEADKLKEDIDALYQGMLERHPALQDYADLQALEEAVAQTRNAIDGPMTRVDFYRLVGQLSHHFNDGHSFLLWPYQELEQLRESGNVLFPFAVEINPDGLFIKHTYQMGEDTIPAGTQIIQMNEFGAEEIIEQAQQYVGGETRTLREQFVAARFAQTLWSVFGYINEFSLTLADKSEQRRITITQTDKWEVAGTEQPDNDAFFYKRLDQQLGYLYVGHFDIDPDWFEDFVDQSFAHIREQNISKLIIDIRDNTGGNTDSVTYLSRYLADKPFRLVSSVKEKLNRENRGIFNYKGDIGEILEKPWDDWVEPIGQDLHFNGDTYLLISQTSYSSAIVFATTLKDNGFATLVGQTTGAYANQTAQGNLFNLPHSELRAYVATRMLVRPNGDTSVHPVAPHIHTQHDKKSIQSKQDTEIEAVRQLLRQNRENSRHVSGVVSEN